MPRRWLFLSAASALVVVSLVIVLLQGDGSDPGSRDAGSVAGARASGASPTGSTPGSPSPSPTRTPTPSASPTAAESPGASVHAPSPTVSATRPAERSTRAVTASAPLAGRIKPGVTYRGVATFYDADGGGACMYDPGGDVLTGAMNSADYESARACGAFVRVDAGGGSVTVRITNECPGDCAPGQIDLSAEAFARLAAPSAGRVPISWTLVSPSDTGTVSVRYKTGSTRWWCGIQLIGHRNPLARLEVRTGGGWRALPRAGYNYFLAEDGGGCGGSIRVTDIYGERLTLDGIAVRPDTVQPTGVQFARH
ncbi:expansin EXLX1 family cellulose-binding protein [Streptomyces griseoviridis]|uniref:expansin EXLX1 family cellulose-binding protein n=1 Tax=Streptomyces griseoviridis TaxID=45398 RepID=UPI00340BB89F